MTRAMATAKTQASILLWSEDGQIGCPERGHAPAVGTDTWRSGRWRPMTAQERIQFEAEVGRPARCESCEAEARRDAS